MPTTYHRSTMLPWPTTDPNPVPDGSDTRTTIMLRALGAASAHALGFEPDDEPDDRMSPVDVAMRPAVRRWEDD